MVYSVGPSALALVGPNASYTETAISTGTRGQSERRTIVPGDIVVRVIARSPKVTV